mmetsp:Transcript_29124/g.37579  ORF Transcript_29124/g.37579 Transcript_29124/m.37579 type:complete len:384 (+) Transcript_29124:117-1268(+)
MSISDEPLVSNHEDSFSEIKIKLFFGLPFEDAIWLFIFCMTGIALGMAFEFLDLYSKDETPAADETFFLCFIGYWAQTIVSGTYALTKPNPFQGSWTKSVFKFLLISALFDGCAQALDYVGQVNGGYMLFTIFHASVTVFSCIIAVILLKVKISWKQWIGVILIVIGIFITTFPNPIKVTGNFFLGFICSLFGSLSLAASYPFSEMVFIQGNKEKYGVITEEMACAVGSLINTFIFTIWTCVYTIPNWKETILHYTKPGDGNLKIIGFVFYGLMVGLHSLSFWKSIHKIGTVPTAVAKGAQQAGIFVFSHLIYCSYDESECIDYNYGNSLWNKLQKSVSFCCCCIGVLIYTLNRNENNDDDKRIGSLSFAHSVLEKKERLDFI